MLGLGLSWYEVIFVVVSGGEKMRFGMTLFHSLPIDMTALMTLFKPEFLRDVAQLLYAPRVHLPEDGYTNPITPCCEGADGFNWLMESLIRPAQELWWDTMITRPEAGRFGLKLEGAGKVRTFAIPNPIFQRLLKPLHDWEMSVLKLLRTDGTFSQLSPLELKVRRIYTPSTLRPQRTCSRRGSMLSGIFGDDLGHIWYVMMNQVAFRSPERLAA